MRVTDVAAVSFAVGSLAGSLAPSNVANVEVIHPDDYELKSFVTSDGRGHFVPHPFSTAKLTKGDGSIRSSFSFLHPGKERLAHYALLGPPRDDATRSLTSCSVQFSTEPVEEQEDTFIFDPSSLEDGTATWGNDEFSLVCYSKSLSQAMVDKADKAAMDKAEESTAKAMDEERDEVATAKATDKESTAKAMDEESEESTAKATANNYKVEL